MAVEEPFELSEEARTQNAMIFDQSVKIWPAFNVCWATMADMKDGKLVEVGQAGFLMIAAPEFAGDVISIGLCDESCDQLIHMLQYLRKGITMKSEDGDMQRTESLGEVEGIDVRKHSVN